MSIDARGNVASGRIQFRAGPSGRVHAYQPADPRTVNQRPPSDRQAETREKYRVALAAWRALAEPERAGWERKAGKTGKPRSGWNEFLRVWMRDRATLPDALMTADRLPITDSTGSVLRID